MESASVNAELPDAFPAALPLAGEGAPVLLVAVLAAMGATLAVVSASIWRAPPVTPPKPVTIVVHEQSPPPPPDHSGAGAHANVHAAAGLDARVHAGAAPSAALFRSGDASVCAGQRRASGPYGRRRRPA